MFVTITSLQNYKFKEIVTLEAVTISVQIIIYIYLYTSLSQVHVIQLYMGTQHNYG